MLFQSLLIPGVLVPAVFAAAVFGLFHWLGKRHDGPAAAGAMALAAAFLSASVALTGWPHWPPIAAIQRVFFLVILAALAAWILGRLGRARTPWAVRVVIVATTLGLTLQSQIKNRWTGGQASLWLAGLLVGALAVAWALDRNLATTDTASKREWLPALTRLALVGSTALMLGLSESAQLAQLVGALACGMAAVEIVGRLGAHPPWQGIDSLVPVTVLTGLISIGHFYAGLGVWPALLLVLAFVLLAPAHQRGAGRVLLPLVPLLLALALVIVTFLNQEDDPYGDYSRRDDGTAWGAHA